MRKDFFAVLLCILLHAFIDGSAQIPIPGPVPVRVRPDNHDHPDQKLVILTATRAERNQEVRRQKDSFAIAERKSKETIVSLRKQILHARRQLEDSKRDKERQADSIDNLVAEYRDVSERLDSLRTVQLYATSRDSAQQSALRQKQEELEQENRLLNQMISQLTDDKRATQAAINSRDSSVAALLEQVSAYEEEMESLAANYLLNEKRLAAEIEELNKKITEQMAEIQRLKEERDSPGEMDYTTLRPCYLKVATDFGQTVTHGYSRYFANRGKINSAFNGGLEIGHADHLLRLGTPRLQLGLNTNFGLHAVGPGEESTTSYTVSSDGYYAASFGLGPQVTFKPIKLIRLGVYSRLVGSMFHTNYRSVEYASGTASRLPLSDMNVDMYNWGLGYDFGVDFTVKWISVGLVWERLDAQPRRHEFLTPSNPDANKFTTYEYQPGSSQSIQTTSAYEEKISFDRFRLLFGFAFSKRHTTTARPQN